jgi:hypothetical protein
MSDPSTPQSDLPEPDSTPDFSVEGSDESFAPRDTGPIVALPTRNWRIKQLIVALVALVIGILFVRDGGWFPPVGDEWSNYRKENAAYLAKIGIGDPATQPADSQHLSKVPHSDLDIFLQKLLATVCIPFGLFWAFRCFKLSSGEYRLTGNTLQVPGHPPVELEEIVAIDRRKWDRKGIAYLTYEKTGGPTGVITLDDFIFERPPTDKIFEIIERSVSSDSDDTTPPPAA